MYCISGLGADERVFEHLELPGCTMYPLPWLHPDKSESIAHYASRMIAGIRHEHVILLGLSFGGIMAVEIAHQLRLRRLWLVSTVRQRSELPPYMRMGAVLPLHKLILPLKPYRWLGPLENYNLDVETPEERAMVAAFRKSVDPVYLDWAIDAIIHWGNTRVPANSLHIHGAKDRIFSIRYVHPDHIIPDAGHLLVHNRSAIVNAIFVHSILKTSHGITHFYSRNDRRAHWIIRYVSQSWRSTLESIDTLLQHLGDGRPHENE